MSSKHVFALCAVKFSDIEKVQRVSIGVPVLTMFEETLNEHQFEVFLNEKITDDFDCDLHPIMFIPHNYIEENK